MLFHVRMDVHLPADLDPQERAEARRPGEGLLAGTAAERASGRTSGASWGSTRTSPCSTSTPMRNCTRCFRPCRCFRTCTSTSRRWPPTRPTSTPRPLSTRAPKRTNGRTFPRGTRHFVDLGDGRPYSALSPSKLTSYFRSGEPILEIDEMVSSTRSFAPKRTFGRGGSRTPGRAPG